MLLKTQAETDEKVIIYPTLRHLVIGESHDCEKLRHSEGDLHDYCGILLANFGKTARLESFAINFNGALGVLVLAYAGILKALEDAPLLSELKKLSIREVLKSPKGVSQEAQDTDPDSEEETVAREVLQALCERRGIDLDERIISQSETFDREQWSSYTRPFGTSQIPTAAFVC
ncbi:hypothetical protein RQP46_008507 [Phenoliferia psychrophenolica]